MLQTRHKPNKVPTQSALPVLSQEIQSGHPDARILTVKASECQRMQSLAPASSNPYENFQRFTAQAMRCISMMDADSIQSIRDFAMNPCAPGAMIVSGLPTDPQLPPTPLDGERAPERASYVGEAVLLGLAALIGEPIGYETEKQGQIIHNLIPIKGAETTQSNRGSSSFLSFHNDSVYDSSDHFHVNNPDFLILYGHRADPARTAKTFYVSAKTLQRVLPDEIVATLSKPHFRMAAPANFTDLINGGKKYWSKPMPILFGDLVHPEIAVAANGVKALTDTAQAALEALTAACQNPDNHTEVLVDSGTALLINNRKGLHARSSFKATYSDKERWLLRANIRQNTWQMRARMTAHNMVFS